MNMRLISLGLVIYAGAAWPQAQDYQAMMQAMDKAQAEAAKPGDDKLTCGQLEDQLVAVAQDPDLLAYVDAAGAQAQKDQEAMNAAKGQIAMQALRAALMSTMPGAAMPGMVSAQAQATAQGAQAMKRNQDRMEQAQKMTAMMPKLMRGQRVLELAVAKNCEWAAGAGMGQ